jgi:hypothetical protein
MDITDGAAAGWLRPGGDERLGIGDGGFGPGMKRLDLDREGTAQRPLGKEGVAVADGGTRLRCATARQARLTDDALRKIIVMRVLGRGRGLPLPPRRIGARATDFRLRFPPHARLPATDRTIHRRAQHGGNL